MVNRIARGIQVYEQRIKENPQNSSKEQLDKLFKTLDVELLEKTQKWRVRTPAKVVIKIISYDKSQNGGSENTSSRHVP